MMGRRQVETSDYIPFARRVIRAAGERCAAADPFDLGELLVLREDVEAAITRAVVGLREQGYSWQDIGDALGIRRQSAQERYAERLSA